MEPINPKKKKMELYIDCLEQWNKRINLVSKKAGKSEINLLIEESLFLGRYISSEIVLDTGSGSGLLGIPIAINWPSKRIVLVETIKKKIEFLQYVKGFISLSNVTIEGVSIQEVLHKYHEKNIALISRGFPKNEYLFHQALKKRIRELLIISSEAKIKNFFTPIENVCQKLYNIPWRSHLVLFRMENVSRETRQI